MGKYPRSVFACDVHGEINGSVFAGELGLELSCCEKTKFYFRSWRSLSPLPIVNSGRLISG